MFLSFFFQIMLQTLSNEWTLLSQHLFKHKGFLLHYQGETALALLKLVAEKQYR